LWYARSLDYWKQVVSSKEVLHHQNAKREDLLAHINMVKAFADQLCSIEVKIEDEKDVYMNFS
jgi:hypothetical protein